MAVAAAVLWVDPAAGSTTYVVNSTGDPGAGGCDAAECTLREAIDAANANSDADNIHFNIPGPGPHTIQPSLPFDVLILSDPVALDATTQPGYSGIPLIVLNGALAGGGPGLAVESDEVTIRGFAINGFTLGIDVVFSESSLIESNHVGSDASGMVAVPNYIGIHLDGSSHNRIGGSGIQTRNLVSGNDVGISMNAGSTANEITGNYIGVNRTGSAALGNETGVSALFASGNFIGGSSAGLGNLISGNDLGVDLDGGTGNLVAGNLIGTDAAGTGDLGNEVGVQVTGNGNHIGAAGAAGRNVISGNFVGVLLYANENRLTGNYIGTDSSGTAALGNESGVVVWGNNNIVGGTEESSGNVISGNADDGAIIAGNLNQFRGNRIGTNAGATAPLANDRSGLLVVGDENVVGGADPNAGNVVSGNGLGIWLEAEGNRIQGNRIGTGLNGVDPIPNHDSGIVAFRRGNLIGGTEVGEGNVIAFNLGDGVHGEPNEIRGNSIYSNGGAGISNIEYDPNPPVITSGGSAAGTACPGCTIDIFSDSEDEGRIYHGSTLADAAGNWSFAGTITGPNITATATGVNPFTLDIGTSAFSAPLSCPSCTPAIGHSVEHASVTLVNTSGAEVGWARFTEDAAGVVHVNVHVKGLSPGEHGIHIHAVGACTPTFAAAGGHHNPLGAQHGLENPLGPHAGDLPELVVNVARVGHLDDVTIHTTLSGGPTSIFDANGSALIIHANEDDQVTDPTGNSGARIACGVIEAD